MTYIFPEFRTKTNEHILRMTNSSCASSSLAPTDFNISTSFEDANGAIIVAVERCQLCSGTKRTFYCKECIQRGHFVHSKALPPQSPET